MITISSPNKHSGRLKAIRLIVIHTMEVSEDDPNVAEAVGRAFADHARQASAHVGVDKNSEVRYVPDVDTAWAAPGANADGLQIELAGRAGQTTGDWTDAASKAILERAAQQVALWCRIYGIPTAHLTDAELGGGKAKGIVGHADVSRVFKQSDHTDPGKAFPWVVFLARVRAITAPRVQAPMPSRSATRAPVAAVKSTVPPYPGVSRPSSTYCAATRAFQSRLATRGWPIAIDGIHGGGTSKVITAFEAEKGLAPDGVGGPRVWVALWSAPITKGA